MPGQAFDGSMWVTAGQSVGLVVGTVAATGVGMVIFARAAQRQLLEMPSDMGMGRPGPKTRVVQRVGPGGVPRPDELQRVEVPKPVVPHSGETVEKGTGSRSEDEVR